MDDIKRVWSFLVGCLHAVFAFVDYFARSSPFILGFVLLALAVLVRIYQRRRHFYGNLNVAGDWLPSYGGIVSAQAFETSLSLCIRLAGFFGIMVLFQHYMPALFTDISTFLLRLTG